MSHKASIYEDTRYEDTCLDGIYWLQKRSNDNNLLINEANDLPGQEEIAILRWTRNFGSICLNIHNYKKHL